VLAVLVLALGSMVLITSLYVSSLLLIMVREIVVHQRWTDHSYGRQAVGCYTVQCTYRLHAACLKQMLTVRYSHLSAGCSNRRRGSRIAISFRGRCHLVHPHHQFNSSRLASVGPSKQRTRGGKGLAARRAVVTDMLVINQQQTEFHLHFKQAAARSSCVQYSYTSFTSSRVRKRH